VSLFYDRDGQPISEEQWVELRRHGEGYFRVASTEIGTEIWVSTVWIGIDHAFGRGRPMIFETMVFGGPMADDCVRYSTAHEAQAGHDAVVTLVLAALDMASTEAASEPEEDR